MQNLKFAIALIFLTSINALGQKPFKGKIVYNVDFEIYNPNISKEMLFKEFGKEATFLFDNGKYYQTYVGSKIEFDIMDSKTELYYQKLSKNDTLFVYDATKKEDDRTIVNTDEGSSDEVVLGRKCNFFQLNGNIDSVNQNYSLKLYFTDQIFIEGSKFNNIRKGFANIVYGQLNSIPIKFEIRSEIFKMIATATEIDENYQFNIDKIIEEKLNSSPTQNLD